MAPLSSVLKYQVPSTSGLVFPAVPVTLNTAFARGVFVFASVLARNCPLKKNGWFSIFSVVVLFAVSVTG